MFHVCGLLVGDISFCYDLHVLKVDPYHVEQPLEQFWSCLND